MIKLLNNTKGLTISSDDIQENLNISEALAINFIPKHTFTWHNLLTSRTQHLKEKLGLLTDWNVPIDANELVRMDSILNSKTKKYQKNLIKINDLTHTGEYKIALERVKSMFDKPFNDGRFMFPYQLETAAIMNVKDRLINAFDPGLGKTLTTLIGIASNPKNKLNLIVTMQRNMNDWIRELEYLGFTKDKDYIILTKPSDMKKVNGIKFHLVSYEKWSNERIHFSDKPVHLQETDEEKKWGSRDLPEDCPVCSSEWKKGNHICNNELIHVHNHIKEIRRCDFSVISKKIPSLSQYYDNQYDSAAIDEGHYIKNGDSQRTKAILRIKSKRKYILTGTPAENGVADLYWLLGWVTGFSPVFDDLYSRQKDIIKPYSASGKVGYDNFKAHFSISGKRKVLDSDSMTLQLANEKDLWNLLDSIMVRKRKTDPDVAPHIKIPKPHVVRQHIELSTDERLLYDEQLRLFSEWYQGELKKKADAIHEGTTYKISSIAITAWMDKLRKVASCPWIFENYNPRNSTTAKIQFAETKIKELLKANKKVLIFSAHIPTIQFLKIHFDNIIDGKRAEYIDGQVNMEYRWDLIRRFQDPDDPLSVLILSHRTGAESYTLTQAKAVFLFDLDYNGKKIEQCWSRAVRLGQIDPVFIYFLLSRDTIDINMHAYMLSNNQTVDTAINRAAESLKVLASQFEGETKLSGFDPETFAKEMLKSGTKRQF